MSMRPSKYIESYTFNALNDRKELIAALLEAKISDTPDAYVAEIQAGLASGSIRGAGVVVNGVRIGFIVYYIGTLDGVPNLFVTALVRDNRKGYEGDIYVDSIDRVSELARDNGCKRWSQITTRPGGMKLLLENGLKIGGVILFKDV